MPNKCGVVNCSGNYNQNNRCRVFRLPKDRYERQNWLDVLPPRENIVVDSGKFFICEKHWGPNPPFVKLPGGSTRPAIPPSIFNVPASYLPTPKPRLVKVEDEPFVDKDIITSFDAFRPECDLQEQYNNLIISRTEEKLVCLFMTENLSECILSVIVENKSTLCSPLICSAFKKGISVPLGKTLNPNKGLRSYSQFAEAVRLAINYEIPFEKMIKSVVTFLQSNTSACLSTEKEKKLVFLTRQLELLAQKQFSNDDYCFALKYYPKCNYDKLRDFLVLPSKRKLYYITSPIDKDRCSRKKPSASKRVDIEPEPEPEPGKLIIDEEKIEEVPPINEELICDMEIENINAEDESLQETDPFKDLGVSESESFNLVGYPSTSGLLSSIKNENFEVFEDDL